jgi:hypothetical protein
MMKTTMAAALTAALAAGAIGCSSSSAPDAAGCKAAMEKMLNASGTTPDTAPAACHGVPAATVSAYASQISASIIAGMGSAAPTATAPVGPANPVPIVKQAGATTTAVHGDIDVYGDRYAQRDIPGATIPGCSESFSVTNGAKCLESVSVYTYVTAADQANWESQNPPSDSNTVISGHLFDLTLYPVSADGNTWAYPVSVATVAKRVHGTVQQ